MSAHMRVVGWVVQPTVMADDGENLVPVQVQPLSIPAAEWDAWVADGWRDSLAQLRTQIER